MGDVFVLVVKKMAANRPLVRGLKLLTAYTSGLFAGGTMFITVVDHPTRLDMIRGAPEGHKSAVRHFKLMHDHVEKMQIPLITTALVGSASVFFLTKGEPKRKLWLIGTGCLAFVFPLTGAHINPKYRKPICEEPDRITSEGPEHVEHMLHWWSFGHRFRASAASLAFIVFLGALL